jgi:hypothetical protein
MAQFSSALRNARGGQIQTSVNAAGGVATFQLFNGVIPATATTALSSNTQILSGNLPTTFLSFTAGVGSKVGTWSGVGITAGTATFDGTFWHFSP